jgi:hypothetical protein
MRNKPINPFTGFWPARTWQLIVVLVVVGLGVVASVALASSGSDQPSAAAGTSEATIEGFAILSRARTSADDPSSYVAQFSGANMTLARRAQGFVSGEAWVVPRSGSICLVAESNTGLNGGAVCNEASAALTGHMAFYATNPKAPGAVFVAGLVRDGVTDVSLHIKTASGSESTQTLPVHENVYMDEVLGTVSTITENGPTPVSVPIKAEAAE